MNNNTEVKIVHQGVFRLLSLKREEDFGEYLDVLTATCGRCIPNMVTQITDYLNSTPHLEESEQDYRDELMELRSQLTEEYGARMIYFGTAILDDEGNPVFEDDYDEQPAQRDVANVFNFNLTAPKYRGH
jgi:hypothetical protein